MTLTAASPVNTGSYRLVRLGDAASNGLKIRWYEGTGIPSPSSVNAKIPWVVFVANLWTEITALGCYAMVKNGNGCKMLSKSWWLQLSKRQKLTFLPNL